MKWLKLAVVVALVASGSTAHAQNNLWGYSLHLVPPSPIGTPVNCSKSGVCFWSQGNGLLALTDATGTVFMNFNAAPPNSASIVMNDGENAAVGAAGTGVLRYNNLTHAFEASLNGGAYGSITTGNWLFSGNNADLSAAGTMGLCLGTCTALSIARAGVNVAINGTMTFEGGSSTDASGDFLINGAFAQSGLFGIKFSNGFIEMNNRNVAPTNDNQLQNGVATQQWLIEWSYLRGTKLGTPLTDAATLAPVAGVTHVTGTGTTVTTITPPIASFVGDIELITDSAITFGNGGNIASTGQITTTPGQKYVCTFDGTSWYIK